MRLGLLLLFCVVAAVPTWYCHCASTPDEKFGDLKDEKIALKTDDDVIQREEQAINVDGLSGAEKKILFADGKKYEFQAEVNRLMSLIIHSLYSNRDIFLRELISNGSDALDKARFQSLTDADALGSSAALEIRIKPDPDNNQLHIMDTGVGMTMEELVQNLGTIAQSGTKEFLDKVEASGDDSNLIGQFGVGFYSAFLVADEVTVTSRANGSDQYVWTSGADNNFEVARDPRGNTLERGTIVTLHLKDDAVEFLEPVRLRSLVRKYSEFINFPIYLWESHLEEREVPIEDEEADEEAAAEDDADGLEAEEDEDDEEEADEDDVEIVEEEVWEWVLLNDVKPLWTRSPSQVSDEEYKNFYKSITKDTEDPKAWTHFSAEGDIDFRCILYVPESPPSNAFESKGSDGLKLYVRRVFISDDFNMVVPKYLKFVRGVIDANGLELNVSREILQQNRSLKMIEKKLVRKIIAMIQSLAAGDQDKYADFYDDYRLHIKLGITEDEANRERLSKLLRFTTSKSEGEYVSFEQYVENMKEGQDQIYYIAGESEEVLERSPLLERLVKQGYEVLFFTDAIDEYMSQTLTTFDGKKLVNVAKDSDLNIDGDEEDEVSEDDFKPLTDYLKKVLGNRVMKVALSKRLASTPSALVSGGFGYTANMERILRAQALGNAPESYMRSRRVMEINPKHPIITELNARVEDGDDEVASEIAEVLYDTAALNSGFAVEDPSAFASRIHRMLGRTLNVEAAVDDAAQDDSAAHEHDEL